MKTKILSLRMPARHLFFLLTAGGLAAASTNLFAQKKEKDKILVNKTYTVDFTETGAKKPKPVPDEIMFKGDKINSKYMLKEHQFPASSYTVSVDSASDTKVITFQSEGKNPNEDIKWEGTVTDEAIEGNAVISKKGKMKKEYSFTGNLKVKPGKKVKDKN